MTRDEYKAVLLRKDFAFLKTQKGYPGRGQEDVCSHPDYRYKFYVTRYDKNNESLYGFYTGKNNGAVLDNMYPRNVLDTFSNKELLMWSEESFIELMKRFKADPDGKQEWTKEKTDEIITVILPTINNS